MRRPSHFFSSALLLSIQALCRPFSLKLSDTKVYEPYEKARPGLKCGLFVKSGVAFERRWAEAERARTAK